MLSYTVRSDIELEGAFLAMENPEKAVISLNSVPVSNIPVGYYVDRDIKTVALPKFQSERAGSKYLFPSA